MLIMWEVRFCPRNTSLASNPLRGVRQIRVYFSTVRFGNHPSRKGSTSSIYMALISTRRPGRLTGLKYSLPGGMEWSPPGTDSPSHSEPRFDHHDWRVHWKKYTPGPPTAPAWPLSTAPSYNSGIWPQGETSAPSIIRWAFRLLSHGRRTELNS